MTAFDVVTSPLRDHEGRDGVPHPLLIEAGAGSGKTWAVSHLTSRLLLEEEDLTPDQILLVTFTRDAASNLRGRVREHLAMVAEFLADPVNGYRHFEEDLRRSLTGCSEDDISFVLQRDWRHTYLALSPEEQKVIARRAERQLGAIDGLRAQTIDSFASTYSSEPAREIAADDKYLRLAFNEVIAAAAVSEPELFGALMDVTSYDVLFKVAQDYYNAGGRGRYDSMPSTLVAMPSSRDLEEDGHAALATLSRFIIQDVADRHRQLLHAAGRTTFSDLTRNIRTQLDDPVRGHHFADVLRRTFKVVMIDEFQDTDPLQWSIFRDVFLGQSDTRLVLVGDPKQAIYAFRSGSVDTFLEVRALCESTGVPVTTLDFNRRSHPDLLSGLNEFFQGATFTYDKSAERTISFRDALPWPHVARRNLLRHESPARIHVRHGKFASDNPPLESVVTYVTELHARGESLRDIAVLCRTNFECIKVQESLTRAGIAAVSSSDQDVYESPAVLHLSLLLAALAEPDRTGFTEALAFSWFGDVPDRATAIRDIVEQFSRIGIGAVVGFLHSNAVLHRVASTEDGERHLTDLLHLAELMVRECRHVRSLHLVADWLHSVSDITSTEEVVEARRLETESDAVRIMTMHKAKGLEFSTVLLPFMVGPINPVEKSNQVGRKTAGVIRYDDDGRVHLDLASLVPWGDFEARCQRRVSDQYAESKRLIYVAMTRAKNHLVVWALQPASSGYYKPYSPEWVRMWTCRTETRAQETLNFQQVLTRYVKPLAESSSNKTPPDEIFSDTLKKLWRDSPYFAIAHRDAEVAITGPIENDSLPDSTFRALTHGDFSPLSREERRWSYTQMAKRMDALEEVAGDDEGGRDGDDVVDTVRNFFGGLGGAALGRAVHEVLEDVVASNVHDLTNPLDRKLRGEGFVTSPAILATASRALLDAASRPLDVLDGQSLLSIDSARSVTEMRFTVSLGHGVDPTQIQAAAHAMRTYDVSGPHGRSVFDDYFARLEKTSGFSGGYAVGALDLVYERADGSFVVFDYKTDVMPGADRPFTPDKLFAAMPSSDYPLQAMVYLVALHRHLAVTMPSYEPSRHLGGAAYYYLRSAALPWEDGDGIAWWTPTPEAIVRASLALGGSR